MSRTPRLLGLDPKVLAGLKDYYETTMLDTNLVSGIAGRRSVFALAARGLRRHKVLGERTVTDAEGTWECCRVEPDNYLLNAGLEQVLAALLQWEAGSDLLGFYEGKGLAPETLGDLRRHPRLELTVEAIPEGVPVFGHEPVLTVEGTFERCQLPESLFLGILGLETAVATQASYVKGMLEARGHADVVTLEGGSRRTYPGAALAASRAALVGGFDGTSLEQLGVEYPELAARVGGSSGHSAILHIGSDDRAFELQFRAYYRIREGDGPEEIRRKIASVRGVGPTFLIDTFDSNGGVEAALRVMKKYGVACQVRNDSGDPVERVAHIRRRFEEEGLPRARIMISDDLKPWKVHRLLEAGARFDLLLMGTYLVNPYKLPGSVYKLAADEDPVTGGMRSVCKVSSRDPAKGTLPGPLDVHRILGRDGRAVRDAVVRRGEAAPLEPGETSIKLNQMVMEKGRLMYDVPDMNQVRENARRHLGLLREEHRRFQGATPYPVVLSDAVRRLRDEFAERQGRS
jgi:nicotinate phosphoribosyltransferase